MVLSDLIEQLNNTERTFEAQESSKNTAIARFYVGNVSTISSAILSKIIPQGKVCLLFTDQSFNRYGENVVKTLQSFNLIPISVILKENDISSKTVSNLLTLPEDVRAVLTLDSSLFNIATYYCNLKKLPQILAVNSLDVFNSLSTHVAIKKEDGIDYFGVNISRYIIIDKDIKFSKEDVNSLIINSLTKIVGLTDYRINILVCGKVANAFSYNLAKNSIIKCCSIINKITKDNICDLLFYVFSILQANRFSGGELFDFSSLSICELYYKNKGIVLNGKQAKALFNRILGVYAVMSCGEYQNLLSVCNYNECAERVNELSNIGVATILKELVNQKEVIQKFNGNLFNVVKGLKDEIFSQNIAIGKINNVLISEQEELDIDLISKVIKSCGDFPQALNGITLAREFGILEYIK